MSTIKVFAPEDLEFDFSDLGLEKTYKVPGDIPTGTVYKLIALEDSMKDAESDVFDKLQDQVVSIFEDRHSEEELDKLNKALGFNSTVQIVIGLLNHINTASEEVKNKIARVRKEARAKN